MQENHELIFSSMRSGTEFHTGNRAEIFHVNRQQKFVLVTMPARLLGSYEEALSQFQV